MSIWMGRSKKELASLPADVVDVFGYALCLAQIGKRHDSTKVLKGFGDASVGIDENRNCQASDSPYPWCLFDCRLLWAAVP